VYSIATMSPFCGTIPLSTDFVTAYLIPDSVFKIAGDDAALAGLTPITAVADVAPVIATAAVAAVCWKKARRVLVLVVEYAWTPEK